MAPKVSELLTPEQVQELRGKSDLAGALLVLHAWALIFGSMALFAWWPNPVTLVLAVMVIGARQLGLAILMHDAAHGVLMRTRWLNEWVSQWLCAYPVGADTIAYRHYHLKHHRSTQQKDDPDLGLSAPFPITKSSYRRKFIRDITGQTGFKQRRDQSTASGRLFPDQCYRGGHKWGRRQRSWPTRSKGGARDETAREKRHRSFPAQKS